MAVDKYQRPNALPCSARRFSGLAIACLVMTHLWIGVLCAEPSGALERATGPLLELGTNVSFVAVFAGSPSGSEGSEPRFMRRSKITKEEFSLLAAGRAAAGQPGRGWLARPTCGVALTGTNLLFWRLFETNLFVWAPQERREQWIGVPRGFRCGLLEARAQALEAPTVTNLDGIYSAPARWASAYLAVPELHGARRMTVDREHILRGLRTDRSRVFQGSAAYDRYFVRFRVPGLPEPEGCCVVVLKDGSILVVRYAAEGLMFFQREDGAACLVDCGRSKVGSDD